jgi:hypothetical protein
VASSTPTICAADCSGCNLIVAVEGEWFVCAKCSSSFGPGGLCGEIAYISVPKTLDLPRLKAGLTSKSSCT